MKLGTNIAVAHHVLVNLISKNRTTRKAWPFSFYPTKSWHKCRYILRHPITWNKAILGTTSISSLNYWYTFLMNPRQFQFDLKVFEYDLLVCLFRLHTAPGTLAQEVNYQGSSCTRYDTYVHTGCVGAAAGANVRREIETFSETKILVTGKTGHHGSECPQDNQDCASKLHLDKRWEKRMSNEGDE
jgi:hypothetical protein